MTLELFDLVLLGLLSCSFTFVACLVYNRFLSESNVWHMDRKACWIFILASNIPFMGFVVPIILCAIVPVLMLVEFAHKNITIFK